MGHRKAGLEAVVEVAVSQPGTAAAPEGAGRIGPDVQIHVGLLVTFGRVELGGVVEVHLVIDGRMLSGQLP